MCSKFRKREETKRSMPETNAHHMELLKENKMVFISYYACLPVGSKKT